MKNGLIANWSGPVVLVNGQHALDTLLRTLAAFGVTCLWCETPGYGLTVHPIRDDNVVLTNNTLALFGRSRVVLVIDVMVHPFRPDVDGHANISVLSVSLRDVVEGVRDANVADVKRIFGTEDMYDAVWPGCLAEMALEREDDYSDFIES